MDFISKSELIAKNRPKELVDWFDTKCQSIIQHEAGKKALRMRERLCKKFIEEIYPLRLLAEFEFSDRDDVRIQWVDGNQNYDALVIYPQKEEKLEITQAIDETDYYRRWLINKGCWAPFNKARMEKTGNKNLGSMRIDVKRSPAEELGTFFDRQMELIDKAIENKINKEYEIGTSLVVMFQDYNFEYLKHAKERLQNFAKEKYLRSGKFSKLYLVGSIKHIFIKCN